MNIAHLLGRGTLGELAYHASMGALSTIDNAGSAEKVKVPAGACMLSGTFLAVISPEGWLDPEAHESDLRGSRGVAVAGGLLIFMGVANFQNTVRLS